MADDFTEDLASTADLADATTSDEQHRMEIERAKRRTIKTVSLTDNEKALLDRVADKNQRKKIAESIKRTKGRFPVSEGWAAPEASKLVTNKAGELKTDKSGTPKIGYKGIGFNYDRDDAGKKLQRYTPEYDRAVKAVTNRALNEIRKTIARAEAGDLNAQKTLRQVGWYREAMKREIDRRGGAHMAFADLLGATSPNTNVSENYKLADLAQQGHARGDFDAQNEFMAGYNGNMNDYPEDQLIRKKSGAQFGMNSRNASMAMTDRWSQEEPGQAPKARNFSGNLSGRSDKATIDVWAARFLNRMAQKARVPVPSQMGVEGDMRPDRPDRKMVGPVRLRASGEFGFGQDVFDMLAKRLKTTGELAPYLKELGYKHVTPADLQALTWFIEKEHWAKNDWTSAAGEGGSFEDEQARQPLRRYQAGFSIQQDAPPSDEMMHEAAQHIHNGLASDDKVRVFRVNPTYGRYGGENERSFDSEVTAHPDWDPSDWMIRHLELAKQHNQKDVFFSRRLDPEEADEHPNARPGVEIYFKNRKAMEAAQPVLDRFTNKGIDGFTYITDLRHSHRTAKGADSKDYVGVRLQWVPEISQRWDDELRDRWEQDPEALKADKMDALERMQDVIHHLDQHKHGIVDARIHNYDTVVSGKEDYDDHIRELREAQRTSGNAAGAARTVAPQVRGGLSLHENIARRNRALRTAEEGGPSGPPSALDGGPDLKFKKGGKVPPYEPGSPIHHPVADDPIIIGAIESDVPGRTDKHECSVPAGSYVIPADVVSALGQGNTLAGQRVLDQRFRQGQHGLPDIHAHMARGGPATTVPVVLAGGEYVVAPAAVARAGMGNLDRGHRALDKFVRATRAKTVKTLRKLPPPKK